MAQPKNITPLYADDINMLEGVDDAELEAYLEEHPRIILLFKIDLIETTTDYATHTAGQEYAYELDLASIMESSRHGKCSKRKWRFPEESRPWH